MKRVALLFAFAAWLVGMTTASAADQPARSPKEGDLATKLQEIADRLELTEEQKAQIAPILEKEIADLKALRGDTSLRRLQRARRAKEITDDASGKIRALLTSEQQSEYDILRAEMREAMKARAKERKAAAN